MISTPSIDRIVPNAPTFENKQASVEKFFNLLHEPISKLPLDVHANSIKDNGNQEKIGKRILFLISHLRYMVTAGVGVEQLDDEYLDIPATPISSRQTVSDFGTNSRLSTPMRATMHQAEGSIGPNHVAAARVHTDIDTIMKVSEGEIKPMSAVLSGKIKLSGDRKAFAHIIPAMKSTISALRSAKHHKIQDATNRLELKLVGSQIESKSAKEKHGYTLYTIEGLDRHTGSKWEIKHRFSDFIKFRKELEAWGVNNLPTLPYGRLQSSTDKNVIKQRMKLLSTFIKAVLESGTFGSRNYYNPCVVAFFKLKKEIFQYQYKGDTALYADDKKNAGCAPRIDYCTVAHGHDLTLEEEEAIRAAKEHADIPIYWDAAGYSKTAVIWKEFAMFREKMGLAAGSISQGNSKTPLKMNSSTDGDNDDGLINTMGQVFNGDGTGAKSGLIYRILRVVYYSVLSILVYVALDNMFRVEQYSNSALSLSRDESLFAWCALKLTTVVQSANSFLVNTIERLIPAKYGVMPFVEIVLGNSSHTFSYFSIGVLNLLLLQRRCRKDAMVVMIICLFFFQYQIKGTSQFAGLSSEIDSPLTLIMAIYKRIRLVCVTIAVHYFHVFFAQPLHCVTAFTFPCVVNSWFDKYCRTLHIIAVGFLLIVVYGIAQLVLTNMLGMSSATETDPGYVYYLWIDQHMAPFIAYNIGELRSIFVKFSQYIGGRSDIMSPTWVAALSKLHDSCPPSDFNYVKQTIEGSFAPGETLNSLFHSFQIRPLASASIAQVHEAQIMDPNTGEIQDVVVKVQHENIDQIMRQDLKTTLSLLKIAQRLNDVWNVMVDAVLSWETSVNEELDFLCEAQYMQEAYENIQTAQIDALVPLYVPSLTCSKVLTMSKLTGYRVNDKLALSLLDIDKFSLLSRITHCIARQLLVDGLLNADPHPGNILFCPNQKLRTDIDLTMKHAYEEEYDIRASMQGSPTRSSLPNSAQNLNSPMRDRMQCSISPGLLDFGMTVRIEEHRRILLCKLFLSMFEYDDFGDDENASLEVGSDEQVADEYDEEEEKIKKPIKSSDEKSNTKILNILKELGYSTNQSRRAPERDVEFFEHILRDAMPGNIAREESKQFFNLRNKQKESDKVESKASNNPIAGRYMTSIPNDLMAMARVIGLLRGLAADIDSSCPILHILALEARVGLVAAKYNKEHNDSKVASTEQPTAVKTESAHAPLVQDQYSATGEPEALFDVPLHFRVKIERAVRDMVRLCDPDCPGWSPLYEKCGVKAMKQAGEFVCVRGEGVVPFPIHDVFRIVLWTERMPELDPRMFTNHRIKPLCICASFEYFRWKPVWPTAPRDMCNMNHWRRLSDGRVLIVSFAATEPSCPEVDGCVRAECILGGYIFEQVPGGTLVKYLVQTDLKGNIPASVAAFVAAEQPLVIDAIRRVLGEDVKRNKLKRVEFPVHKKQRIVTYDELAYICDDTRPKPEHSIEDIFAVEPKVEEAQAESTPTKITDTVSVIPSEFKQRTNANAEKLIRLLAENCPNWEVLYEKEGVKASKLSGGGICVKGESVLKFAIHDVFKLVCTTSRMTELDTQMFKNRRLKQLQLGSCFEYYRWKPVWPTAARDMSNFSHWRLLPDGRVLIVSYSVTLPECPVVDGCVRAQCLVGGYIFEQVSGGTLVKYLVETDLKGSLPASVSNMVATGQPMIIGKIRTLLEIDTKNGLVPQVEFEGKKQRPVTFDELAYYNDQAGGGHLCIPKPDFDGAYDLFKEVAPLSKPPAPTAAPRVADRSKGSGASSPAIVGTPVKAPPVKDQCDNTSKETNETRPPSSHPSAPGVDATSPSPAVEHPVLLTTSRVNQIPPKHPQGASKKTNSIGGNSNPVPRPSSAGEDEVVSRSSMYSLLDADDTTSATRDIDQAFFEAVKIAKTLPSNLSSDAKLSIYAHYKMAMNGPCDSNVKVPGVFDVVGRAKYDAWKKLSDSDAVNSSSSRNAKKAYVDLVERLKEAHSK